MWIKTKYEEYVNTDNIVCIEYAKKTHTTNAYDGDGNHYILCDGDYAMDIVQNIISETKYMEVQ